MSFFYVYILKLSNEDYYVGRSDNLKRRIGEHLRGEDKTTSKFLPLKLITYLAFDNKTVAVKFEKYLKTGSGIAFRRKHLV
jgi:putative endonuclease